MTKILVIGLDCAAPELLFGDERLTHFRRLMGNGCYGRLESVIPPITVPAWMCLATSQDPGSLGVYGFRNRADHSYEGLRFANARSIVEPAIWDQVSRQGGRSNIIGVPPSYPPRRVDGICVGCFLTPDTRRSQYTHPALIQERIAGLVGDYPVDVKGFRTHRKDWLKQQIDTMTHKHFEVVRHFLQRSKWDYFQFVEIGLDRIHHGFWQYHDPRHRLFEAGNPYREVVGDYYRLLDGKVGELLELLDEEAVILVVSDHGAKPLDGGFCVNEWLIRQGWLVLNRYPREVTPFGQLAVDWDRTRVWSEGGYYARVFLNVKGREPRGTIAPEDYESFRDEVAARLEALPDDLGRPMGTQVFKPERIYRAVRKVAPDLIAHFGGLSWRSIGSVGGPSCTCRRTTPAPTAAITPNRAPSSSTPPDSRGAEKSREPTCWTWPRRCSGLAATTCPAPCREPLSSLESRLGRRRPRPYRSHSSPCSRTKSSSLRWG